jgi:hypothetical protein
LRPVGTFVGSTAPNMGGFDQYGNHIDLKSQRGRWVLMAIDPLRCPAGQAQERGLESLTQHLRGAHVPFTALTMAYANLHNRPMQPGDAEDFARGLGSWSPVIGSARWPWIRRVYAMSERYSDAPVEQGGTPATPQPERGVPVDVIISPSGLVSFISIGQVDLNLVQRALHPSFRLSGRALRPDRVLRGSAGRDARYCGP